MFIDWDEYLGGTGYKFLQHKGRFPNQKTTGFKTSTIRVGIEPATLDGK